MKIVGLTGGIGSGKTTVAHLFAQLGAPVFFADDEAKLVYEDKDVVEQVKMILGSDKIVDENGKIIRAEIAAIIFSEPSKRMALNELIHPLVRKRFVEWMSNQNFEYCIREAAILIESDAYKDCDEIIVVTSPLEQRVKRVMDRDGANKEEVEKRIMAQMSDEDRLKYATFVIENNAEKESLKAQVLKIHLKLV